MNYMKLPCFIRLLPVVAVALAMTACGNNPPKQHQAGAVGKITSGNTAHCYRQ